MLGNLAVSREKFVLAIRCIPNMTKQIIRAMFKKKTSWSERNEVGEPSAFFCHYLVPV